ncbi:RNA polymerase sigma factor [Microbacterium testaceum]|uniref:RNA polymerase sigma factor n=1 Tax=Microbacterium testaceum TaxID=2033 RepID=UPI0027D7C389|nr:sigma-70 family RNA polymerase sigma factor [Microbacterium testaceum]
MPTTAGCSRRSSASPEREQAVVVLSVLEGYAEREIAQALGIPAGTVKSRLARAKAKLRDELALEGARA